VRQQLRPWLPFAFLPRDGVSYRRLTADSERNTGSEDASGEKRLEMTTMVHTQVTLDLPDSLYRSAARLAVGVKQPVSSILTDVLSTALGVWDIREEPIQSWSDEQVLSGCDAQMSARQSERMSELLDRQQTGLLAADEKPELWALLRVYELGQLRKAEALAEATRRGLRLPGNT
jgi:hypothetical protein